MTKERNSRMEDAAQEAQEQVKQDGQEWSEADNDEGDGGQPVLLIRQDPALNPRDGGSKVNRAERLAREKVEAKKRKDQEKPAKVASRYVDTWNTKDEVPEWADQIVPVSTDEEGTKPSNGATSAVEGWLSKSTDREAVSWADHEGISPADGATKSSDERAKLDEHRRSLSVDQGLANSASQGVLASDHEPLKPSNKSSAHFGFVAMQKTSARETSLAEPIQAAEVSNPLQSPTSEGVDEESVVSDLMLQRLASLESMDSEEGGVPL